MFLYRRFRTQAEIDAEYNLGARLDNPQEVFEGYRQASASARRTLDAELGLRYGPTLDEQLDIFPATRPGAPVLLFVHGGYWRMLSQRDFSFVAAGLVPHGVTVAIGNYSLCPRVTISEITRQNRALVAWLYANAARFNGNPHEIRVMGHSAGGHQAAMLVGTDWRGEYGLPGNTIKAGIAVSGIFDLEPLRHSFLQPTVQLDHDLVLKQSPIRNVPRRAPPLRLHVGRYEPREFIRQSRDMQRAWKASGLDARLFIRPGVDHFAIINDLARPRSRYCARVLRDLCLRD